MRITTPQATLLAARSVDSSEEEGSSAEVAAEVLAAAASEVEVSEVEAVAPNSNRQKRN